jgi:hypothetical protein
MAFIELETAISVKTRSSLRKLRETAHIMENIVEIVFQLIAAVNVSTNKRYERNYKGGV